MDKLKEKLIEFAKKEGIDVLGFASKDRFAGVDPQKNPFLIFPEGETVIMLGKRICRGSLRGVEEGTNFSDYKAFGYKWLEDEFCALACYNMTAFIEDEGYEAVPVFPNPSEIGPMGVSVDGKRPAPNVFPDFDFCAVASGTAVLSANNIAFTPSFGSRQRYHMIITDAKMEPTPILDKNICDYCGLCAKSCPLGAISFEELTEIDIFGRKMKVAKIDFDLCRKCHNGAVINRFSEKAKPDRVAALCNRTCLCHLEENNLIENVFENNFRQREPWAKDYFCKNVNIE